MNAKEKLLQLDEISANALLQMAEVGYRLSKPPSTQTSGRRAYRTLMDMTGCADAKQKIKEVLAASRMQKILKAKGRQTKAAHYHMAFFGPPGSAKTTTARLYSEILFDEGLIKNKNLIELSKASLVGRYQGETPQLIKQTFEKKQGSCILIDEAYSLFDTDTGHSNTFGSEAVDQIILELEEATDTVVIFAGYTDRMQAFLDSNPGLRSRIPIEVSFPDYSTTELADICKKIACENGYTINEEAEGKLFHILDTARTQDNFGNGRYCRNLVEKAIAEKSIRLGIMNDNFDFAKFIEMISEKDLFTLDEECFPEPVYREKTQRIGF